MSDTPTFAMASGRVASPARVNGGAAVSSGPAGASAFAIAVAAGFGGTQAQWLAALVGPAGKDGGDIQIPFAFPTPATTWHVIHNLGRHPRVLVMDADGNEVIPRVRHFDVNVLEIGHAMPFSGIAYLT